MRLPRAPGVSSCIQRTASRVIRNHTWLLGRGELVAEPEGLAVGFPVGVERRQGSRATGPVLARSFDDDRRPVGHECVFALPPKSFTISPVIVKDSLARIAPTRTAVGRQTATARQRAGRSGRDW